jgi:hypothetical protein
MNLRPLTVLNDKLQAAIRAENLELADVALDQMKDEVSSLQNRAKVKSWMNQYFSPLIEDSGSWLQWRKGSSRDT